MRRSFRRCSSTLAPNPSPTSSVSVPQLQDRFEHWLNANNAVWAGNAVVQLTVSGRDAEMRRGLVATKNFRSGMTIMALPMQNMVLSNATLTAAHRNRANSMRQDEAALLPPIDETTVHQLLISRGVADPGICPQVYLALLLAAERMQADSFYAPYLDLLPYPAVPDAAVMRLHKEILSPMDLLEWDDHQREFNTSIRTIHARWEHASPAAAPPLEVLYWALRTIFARHFQLPDKGLTPMAAGSKLDYMSFQNLKMLVTDSSRLRRLVQKVKSCLPQSEADSAFTNYQLVPTLVPLLDLTGHRMPSNVITEVRPRAELGSCVELQAVSDIKEGDELVASYNRCHSIAFTLYRFGFLPV